MAPAGARGHSRSARFDCLQSSSSVLFPPMGDAVKGLVVLGSTGSTGIQALDIVRALPRMSFVSSDWRRAGAMIS